MCIHVALSLLVVSKHVSLSVPLSDDEEDHWEDEDIEETIGERSEVSEMETDTQPQVSTIAVILTADMM